MALLNGAMSAVRRIDSRLPQPLNTRWAPLIVGTFAAVLLYLPIARVIDRPRPDFFYLADAFLHGRTWLDPAAWLGPQDVVPIGDRVYLPFGPFPAMLFVPLVAALGVSPLVSHEHAVNAVLAGICVGASWPLFARFDRGDVRDRTWLVVLFAFSTDLWSITTLGGVWHTGQLVAAAALLLALLEATGRRRPLLMGALIGAAILCRVPIALSLPFFLWVATRRQAPSPSDRPAGLGRATSRAALLVVGLMPFLGFLAWYNVSRFGSPLESGYALATLTEPTLIAARQQGLFALAHVPDNLRYLLWEPPVAIAPPFFLKPSGYGFPILLQSPGLLLAVKARWGDRFVVAAALTALAVLVPSLLYYGGGFYQFGFRYLLDAMPFVLVLVASAARHPLTRPWKLLIVAGVLVNLWGAFWS